MDEECDFRTDIIARSVLNRCPARAIVVQEVAEALADQTPAMLAFHVGQRVAFAGAARSGRFVADLDEVSLAAREIAAFAREVERLAQ